MKSLIISTGFAAVIGALGMSAAGAAPIATHGVIVAPAAATDVACRTVKKTVVRNRVRRTTTSQTCDRDRGYDRRYVERRRVYGARPYYRPARPGFSIRVN